MNKLKCQVDLGHSNSNSTDPKVLNFNHCTQWQWAGKKVSDAIQLQPIGDFPYIQESLWRWHKEIAVYRTVICYSSYSKGDFLPSYFYFLNVYYIYFLRSGGDAIVHTQKPRRTSTSHVFYTHRWGSGLKFRTGSRHLHLMSYLPGPLFCL